MKRTGSTVLAIKYDTRLNVRPISMGLTLHGARQGRHTGSDNPGGPYNNAISSGTRMHRPRLHCWCACGCIALLILSTVKGGELSYTPHKQWNVSNLRSSRCSHRQGAVLADPEPMPSRLGRGCIAVAFTAGVRAVA